MRRLALAVALVLGLASLAWSADGPSPGLTADQVLRGRFVQERHLKGFAAPLRSSGHFVLAPGQGLIWTAEAPFAVTTVMTAAGIVQTAGGVETTRLSAARLPFMARLYDMLGAALVGNWQSLDGVFVVSHTVDSQHWQARLVPRQADDVGIPFRAIDIMGARFVDRVAMTKADGDSDELSFLEQSLSASLAPDEIAALGSVTK